MTNLIIQKISDHGTQHPAFARLLIQTSELIQWASLSKDERNAIVEIYADKLKPRLLKCDEILTRLNMRLHESCNELASHEQNQVIRVIPHVSGLNSEAENFAYEVKNYLRDALGIFRVFFGCELTEARVWYDAKGKGDSELVKWATQKFGAHDELTKLLRTEQPWCEEWIRLRNALEHPNDKSGNVIIHNVRPHPDGLIPPSWSRDGATPTDLFSHMTVAMQNMLTLVEDMLILSIGKKKLFAAIEFYEIPEKERAPEAPQRFGVGLKPEFAKHIKSK